MNSKIILPQNYGRLLIREYNLNDRDALIEFVRDPDQLKYMMFSLSSEKEIDDFLNFAQSEVNKEDRKEWHLALEDESGYVGSVALMIEKDASCSAELGYYFKRSAWGKGYATEGSRFILQLGFRMLGLHRIWGKCHVDNPASANVMKKIGMMQEGKIREHIWLRDHYRSSFLFSMLENEYNE
jgi:[ribosomal protein S5]-alanine N-acetyltransferase